MGATRILAIDYGRRRIGLAATDALGLAVHPLEALHGTPDDALPALTALARDRETELLVVGLPLHADGREGDMAEEARAFGARLAAATGLPVEHVDERHTSQAALEHLNAGKRKHRRRATGLVDSLAAVEILRDWLSHR